MTRDEVEVEAKRQVSDLGSADTAIRIRRYRRWVMVGAVRWEATSQSQGDVVQMVFDDASGRLILLMRHSGGIMAPKTREQITRELLSLLPLLVLVVAITFIWKLLPPWGFWLLVFAALWGFAWWVRLRVFRRRSDDVRKQGA